MNGHLTFARAHCSHHPSPFSRQALHILLVEEVDRPERRGQICLDPNISIVGLEHLAQPEADPLQPYRAALLGTNDPPALETPPSPLPHALDDLQWYMI